MIRPCPLMRRQHHQFVFNSGQAIIFSWNHSIQLSLLPLKCDVLFGHQAILCKDAFGDKFFASFWPCDENPGWSTITASKGFFARNIVHDMNVEKNEPSEVLVLSDLDFDKMKAAFEKMKTDLHMSKMRFSLFSTQQPMLITHNCTSVVHTIVQAGGHAWTPMFPYASLPHYQANTYKKNGAELIDSAQMKQHLIREAKCIVPFSSTNR